MAKAGRLHARLLAWGGASPRAAVAAFATAALLESLFVPFVIDALLLALVLGGAPLWRCVAAGAAASLLGTMAWYGVGVWLGPDAVPTVAAWLHVSPDLQAQAADAWRSYWFGALILASLTAVPDPLAAATAGASQVPFLGAVAALAIGHALRFALIGAIVWVGWRLVGAASPLWRRRLRWAALWVGLLAGVLLAAIGWALA